MKLLVALSAVLCLATAVPLQVRDHTLEDSIKDFFKVVDFNQVLPVVLEGLSEDEQVIETMNVLQGPDFIRIVTATQATTQFKHTLAVLYDLGLDVYFYLNAVAEIMGWPEMQPGFLSERRPRTLLGFIDQLKAVLPLDELQKIYDDKMQNDQVFIAAMNQIRSKEFNEIGDMIRAMPEWTVMMNYLESKGIDAEAVLQAILDFFGWH